MVSKSPIKQVSPAILDIEKLQTLVIDLDEQKQASISGGDDTKRYAKVLDWDCKSIDSFRRG